MIYYIVRYVLHASRRVANGPIYSYRKLLSAHQIDPESFYIVIVDGKYCKNISDFIATVAHAFRFPDYYGKNMDAFWECINDLDWLDKPNYALIIENSRLLLSEETKELTQSMMEDIDRIREEWANVPNYQGEGEFRKRARFEILFI